MGPYRRYLHRAIAKRGAVLSLGACVAFAPLPVQHAEARESFVTTPSSQFVATFFANMVKIIFLEKSTSGTASQAADLRALLARSMDADAIGRFILGRFGKDKGASATPVAAPAEGFLDFAAAAALRMTPRHRERPGDLPALAIVDMKVRADQTRLVQSDLVLPGGRRLPLVWEVAEHSTGPQIEDVSCLGISLRLMLRSAVAQAAAEHPEDAQDLARLLSVDGAMPPFATPEAP